MRKEEIQRNRGRREAIGQGHVLKLLSSDLNAIVLFHRYKVFCLNVNTRNEKMCLFVKMLVMCFRFLSVKVSLGAYIFFTFDN